MTLDVNVELMRDELLYFSFFFGALLSCDIVVDDEATYENCDYKFAKRELFEH